MARREIVSAEREGQSQQQAQAPPSHMKVFENSKYKQQREHLSPSPLPPSLPTFIPYTSFLF